MADLINLQDDAQGYKTRPVKDWKVDDVCDFLAALELKSLLPSVKENAVDGAMLLELSDGELEEDLGFKSLQIKKMKRSLEGHTGVSAAAAATPAAPTTPALAAAAAPKSDPVAEAAKVAEAARAADAAKAAVEAAQGAQATAARFAAARDLLGSAHHDLHSAKEQLHQAMTAQAVNTGTEHEGIFHRGLGHHHERAPVMSMATAGAAHKRCEAAKQLSDKASRTIEQARKYCPELPPIRTPDINVVGGIVMQEIFDSTVADAVRLGKIRAAEGEIARCATEVKLAYERCGATDDATAAFVQPAAAVPLPAQPAGYAPAYTDPYATPPLQEYEGRRGPGMVGGVLIGEAIARPRIDERRFEERHFEEPRFEERRFEEPRFEERRFEERRFEEPRFEERRRW